MRSSVRLHTCAFLSHSTTLQTSFPIAMELLCDSVLNPSFDAQDVSVFVLSFDAHDV